MHRVYLDHAATTPLDPRVLEAMLPYFGEHYGNPSAVHALGRKARFAVEESRERIASLLGVEPAEVLFTSGGTESNNTAIFGAAGRIEGRIVTSAAEHEAVLRPAAALEASGRTVVRLAPAPDGGVSSEQVRAALDGGVALVSLMMVNNELGTLTDVAGIAQVCRDRGVLYHCDAVQATGLYLDALRGVDADLVSVSGHKVYGPKGSGLLVVRGGADLKPLIEGGAQERRRRGGTENVPAVVGLAEALALAAAEGTERRARIGALRARLAAGLRETLEGPYVVNTHLDDGASAVHILNVSFPPDDRPLDGEMLLLNLDLGGVCASAGSACTSGALEPSHVLTAIGLDRASASAALRFSLGKETTEADIDRAVDVVGDVISRMRRRTGAVTREA